MAGRTWRALFDRARDAGVTEEDIHDALADQRADA